MAIENDAQALQLVTKQLDRLYEMVTNQIRISAAHRWLLGTVLAEALQAHASPESALERLTESAESAMELAFATDMPASEAAKSERVLGLAVARRELQRTLAIARDRVGSG